GANRKQDAGPEKLPVAAAPEAELWRLAKDELEIDPIRRSTVRNFFQGVPTEERAGYCHSILPEKRVVKRDGKKENRAGDQRADACDPAENLLIGEVPAAGFLGQNRVHPRDERAVPDRSQEGEQEHAEDENIDVPLLRIRRPRPCQVNRYEQTKGAGAPAEEHQVLVPEPGQESGRKNLYRSHQEEKRVEEANLEDRRPNALGEEHQG